MNGQGQSFREDVWFEEVWLDLCNPIVVAKMFFLSFGYLQYEPNIYIAHTAILIGSNNTVSLLKVSARTFAFTEARVLTNCIKARPILIRLDVENSSSSMSRQVTLTWSFCNIVEPVTDFVIKDWIV
jgi:hypothetical protein